MFKSNEQRPDEMFPTLSEAQVARLTTLCTRRRVTAGEVLYEPGWHPGSIFVVLDGALEIVNPSKDGETRIVVLAPGQFTGEINILAGRPTLL